MKISKLFHWLYAVVMLLPVFAIGVTCGYAMFNKNAYQSYAGEHINNSTQIDTTIEDMEQDKTYYIKVEAINVESSLSNVTLRAINIKNLSSGTDYDNTIYNRVRFFKGTNTQIYTQILRVDSGTAVTITSNSTIQFDYIATENTGTIEQYLSFYYLEYEKLSFVSEVFYYSVDRVTQSNMFSWAYDSFLVTPFAYIVNLFSMPINSPVVMLLSYWLTISVIWLVFDLIMYVPLLAHRWLDKGMVE